MKYKLKRYDNHGLGHYRPRPRLGNDKKVEGENEQHIAEGRKKDQLADFVATLGAMVEFVSCSQCGREGLQTPGLQERRLGVSSQSRAQRGIVIACCLHSSVQLEAV